MAEPEYFNVGIACDAPQLAVFDMHVQSVRRQPMTKVRMIEISLVRFDGRTTRDMEPLHTLLPRAFGCPSGRFRSVWCGVNASAYLLPVAQ